MMESGLSAADVLAITGRKQGMYPATAEILARDDDDNDMWNNPFVY